MGRLLVPEHHDEDNVQADAPPTVGDHPDPAPDCAVVVFGDRLDLAVAYHRILATDGIDHGLMGPREIPRLWDRHILNCAVIADVIERDERVVDIGSGAGLPGIPLAIARPDLRIVLLEPLLRRSTFLERTVEALGLDVRVLRGRAEEKAVLSAISGADVVTSRAVAPLERLSKWSAPLVRDGGRMVAIKGSSAAEEIERDAAVVGRYGISGLRVQVCGVDVLPSPTTVVVGTKSASGGSGRDRRKKR
ncbi:16S rRNA (guanine(527)-N(7))-methyltransferase RsmG [Gordonia sp. ABSL1-1]|uniref:16S rRNA (guanine(527)-N(7))-methyltransferase RsmG n=1 Tax=Gordonia sp. ABSL1-1 TaxID=3053923 RepID=UPI0025728B15|nr:16S rRNA (guanine(527)-N(7))-methyltransferase RsmG [Gordonia sp. ABSL1-1]MDL9936615.1 16S rRNA (guanine(527)-N(7))-methyltransferase RsmG [Gordonia sp. ABSL1-1]